MNSFTRYYREAANLDFTDLPNWDLYAALRHAAKSAEWATYDMDETLMREKHKLFTSQAFEMIQN